MHQFKAGGVDLALHEFPLDVADAVFAGQRAIEGQDEIEDLVEAGGGLFRFLGLVRIEQKVDVDVAVAGMAEVDDGQGVFVRQRLEAADETRDA